MFDLVACHHPPQINVRVNYSDSNSLNTLRTVPVFVHDLFHSPNHTFIVTDHLLKSTCDDLLTIRLSVICAGCRWPFSRSPALK